MENSIGNSLTMPMEFSIGIADEHIPSVLPMENSIGNNLAVPMEISIGITDDLNPSVVPMEIIIGKDTKSDDVDKKYRWKIPSANSSKADGIHFKKADGIIRRQICR
ncbi:hypothetical protein CASFOL_036826 [Castilleja foliolosa]|uniref:Uncharacterized protein n=1 Tax=Castilleja foliolosa TaxID=1961234 RepID=A0ABD3BQI3_9LAMI